MSLTEIASSTSVHWIDVAKPNENDKQEIRRRFHFHQADLQDAFRSTLRSQVVVREKYIFLVLMVPFFDTNTHTIQIHESDLFIQKDSIVSIHHKQVPPFIKLKKELNNTTTGEALLSAGSNGLLAEMLHRITDHIYPMMDHIDQELEEIKTSIFSGETSRRILVEEILRIRGNITDMRKALRGYTSIYSHLTSKEVKLIKDTQRLEGLLNDAKDIWASLESHKEEIEALEDANESMITHNLNEIFKTLTAFSTILLPAAVLAGIFGMNVEYAPFLGQGYDFWWIIGLMGLSTTILFIIFWKKHWLH